MITKESHLPEIPERDLPADPRRSMTVAWFASRVFILATLSLFIYSLAWNFSVHRYLTGFVDAIVPLAGSPQEKTEALVKWFHDRPQRLATSITSSGSMHDRDPVNIVQDTRLLRICGSASNAFMNLADAAGLKVRRLLLLDQSGSTKHVVAEVRWGDRWIVVNPQQGLVFKDHTGRALTKEELRDPKIFQDAISQMPGYSPDYTFDHTVHIRLKRIPIFGGLLRKGLDRFIPGWEEAINWGYFPENPSLWMILLSSLLLLVGILGYLTANTYSARQRCIATSGFHK